MQVDLSRMPSYPKTYVVDFPRLDGGLNLRDLSYRLKNNESPSMMNMWWEAGILQGRNGQAWKSDDETLGTGYACYDRLFRGYAIFHIGMKLYCADHGPKQFALQEIYDGVPENTGTFFTYQDCLYYKNYGGFFCIEHKNGAFLVHDMQIPDEYYSPYTPVTVINASPETGSGALYQPENRLSALKEVWYNADGESYIYYLPVSEIDDVKSVTVDGVPQVHGVDYLWYNLEGRSFVQFVRERPSPGTPAANNTVKIVYSKGNTEALSSIMDCPYATVAGNGNNLCILLGGCPAQPNVVFWNSNDSLSMNPGYFPMSYYNLCGPTDDAVTGFGRQYSDLILFKEHSIGKLDFTVESVDGRDSISFTWQNINAEIGCDLPRSIQLIENNLVFANRRNGVYIVRSSSTAYENNVECISDKVNGVGAVGLLHELRDPFQVVCSIDDGERYWLCVNGSVYLWDYGISAASDPSWFYFSEVHGVAYYRDDENNLYHLDAVGRVTVFARNFADYGEAIDKNYTFPVQSFGTYDRLKDVESIVLSVRSDTNTTVNIKYSTDYEQRVDLTPILGIVQTFIPRDLSHRDLTSKRYGLVARRKPGCRHIRHFTMTLANWTAYEDLAIVSAQIFYRYSGKER